MGQENGLSVSEPVSEQPTNCAESSNLSALMKREVLATSQGCAQKHPLPLIHGPLLRFLYCSVGIHKSERRCRHSDTATRVA